MKRLIFIALIALVAVPVFGQKVHFGNITNVWSNLDSTIGCCVLAPRDYKPAWYDSITVDYNGYTWQYLHCTMQSFLVREESNKVYFTGAVDSVERLAYDFNLGIGDTMRIIYPMDTFISWVTNIDSTLLQGISYKVWHFNGNAYSGYFPDSVRPFQYNVIEGLGCTNGVYYPANPYALTAFSQHLLCFNNNSNINTAISNPVVAYASGYNSVYDNDSSCIEYYTDHTHHLTDFTGVKQITINSNSVIVAPNPVTAESNFILPYHINSGSLTITNIAGQIIGRSFFEDKEMLPVPQNFTSGGIYFYHITDNQSGKIFSGKFQY
jgi:hypothetical protein